MTISPKTNCLQTYQTVLYERALHPELFGLKGRRVIRHGRYELEAWLTEGGHVLRFEHDGACCTELVTDQERGLPEAGVVSAFLCAGERDFEHDFKPSGLHYMTTVQTEQLSENLYAATLAEMRAHAAEVDAAGHEYDDGVGRCLSMVDIQRYAREIHVQSYHLVATGGVVLRTQSLFEHP